MIYIEVSYRMYDDGDDVLLAACDIDLLGRTFDEGDLSLEVKESFYGDETLRLDEENGKKELHKKFERCTVANLVGEHVIDAAIEAGLGEKSDVMDIGDVPHLQIVRM